MSSLSVFSSPSRYAQGKNATEIVSIVPGALRSWQQKNTPDELPHREQSESSVSRVLFAAVVANGRAAVIPLGRALPRVSCGLPRGSGEQPSNASLRGLAPDGVCRAEAVTDFAVGSYPTVSPLPEADA